MKTSKSRKKGKRLHLIQAWLRRQQGKKMIWNEWITNLSNGFAIMKCKVQFNSQAALVWNWVRCRILEWQQKNEISAPHNWMICIFNSELITLNRVIAQATAAEKKATEIQLVWGKQRKNLFKEKTSSIKWTQTVMQVFCDFFLPLSKSIYARNGVHFKLVKLSWKTFRNPMLPLSALNYFLCIGACS